MEKSSRLPEFYKKTPKERLALVRKFAELSEEEASLLEKTGALDIDLSSKMIENVIGTTELPLGIAANFRINGRDFLIPMAIEEPSVVAAASNAAKLAREAGGFTTSSTEPIMIGQIQLSNTEDPHKAAGLIMEKKTEFIEFANKKDLMLLSLGGGVRDIETRIIDTKKGKMLIVHLLVNVLDAMGANAVNTMTEALAPKMEELTGGQAFMKIISNLAVHRTAKARAVWTKEALERSVKGSLKGEEVVEAILQAYAFADADQFRCTTYNKGVMNGVDAVVIATGNDFRAVEAGAHSFAALKGRYKPLTRYSKDGQGDLVGEIELPVAVGVVGGATKTHPVAGVALKILGVKGARELGEVIAAVGLAQNFAALRALATEGIQRGHLRLHAKNFAVMAGAKEDVIDKISNKMIEENNISYARASELLKELSK